MGKIVDLTEMTFGRLKVIEFAGIAKNRKALWKCECSCENHTIIIVQGSNLRNGNTQSCGCLHKEKFTGYKHGYKHTKLYGVWCGMKSRCQNPNSDSYKNYGGRGIRVCKEWQTFEPFYKWSVDTGYQEGLTIERKDVNGDYCPENCCWATQKVQANNTRTNHFIEYKGKRQTLQQWEEEAGLPIGQRLSYGWTLEESIETPLNNNYRVYEFNGEKHTIAEWSKIANIKYGTLYNRLVKLNWNIEKALDK